MIITKDFVFIHMPKTGGTFVHGAFKQIISKLKSTNPLHWYFNRFLLKYGNVIPIYQKLTNVVYNDFPNCKVEGQHGGMCDIPEKYHHLPVVSVKRDPIKKFESSYYYKWWERFPIIKIDKLKKEIPNYPDITIEEYFILEYEIVMKHFFKDDFRKDIGILSWQYIRMYSKNPLQVYKEISKDNFNTIVKLHFNNVTLIENNSLNNDFSKYLEKTRYRKYAPLLKKSKKIYPPGSSPNKKRPPTNEKLIKKIKEKEWLIYKFHPEYL